MSLAFLALGGRQNAAFLALGEKGISSNQCGANQLNESSQQDGWQKSMSCLEGFKNNFGGYEVQVIGPKDTTKKWECI